MSGGPRSRFSRSVNPAADRMTIEREKIRHRRPDDMRVQDTYDATALGDDDIVDFRADEQEFVGSSSWSDEEADWPEEDFEHDAGDAGWDDGGATDDEWVFGDVGPKDLASDDIIADDGLVDGVIWEDSDDIEIGGANSQQDYGYERRFGPEVELAGRRDVRPKQPKRPMSPQTRRMQPNDAGGGRRVRSEYDDGRGDFTMARPAMRQTAGKASAARPRFAKTQATLEIDTDRLRQSSRGRTPPFQINQHAPSRGRQAPKPMAQQAPKRRSSSKALVRLIVVAMVVVVGWFSYRNIDPDHLASLTDRLGLPVLGGRTASETPFGTAATPEEALQGLAREDRGDALLGDGGGYQVGDPTTSGPNDPPLPNFKPRNEPSGQVSSSSPAGLSDGQAKADATADGGSVEGPSLMQKIWGNLIAN